MRCGPCVTSQYSAATMRRCARAVRREGVANDDLWGDSEAGEAVRLHGASLHVRITLFLWCSFRAAGNSALC